MASQSADSQKPDGSGDAKKDGQSSSASRQQQYSQSSATGNANTISEEVIKKHYRRIPISFYRLKDQLIQLTSTASFLDAVLVSLAFIAVVTALNFYPIPVIIILLVLIFAATIFHPFIGLILFTFSILPVLAYQTPVLAWAFLVGASLILLLGYKHYRIAIFIYILSALAFSPLGAVLEIPLFIYSVLTIGNKRAIVMLVAAVSLIAMFSAATGMQNTSYILYNAGTAHSALQSSPITTLDTPNSTVEYNISAMLPAISNRMLGNQVMSQVPDLASVLLGSLFISPIPYLAQTAILACAILVMDFLAVTGRSKFKGAQASLVGIAYPLSYAGLATFASLYSQPSMITAAISFVLTPVAIYLFEYYDIPMVRALDVRKQDVMSQFGTAFEDLGAGMTSESFNDIGNYDTIKKELKEAVVSPIEERGISRAYNVQPTKGILFFGPPGTGKTMMMRALANEIHAGFYYVKASNLVSAFPGETEKLLSNIFTIAKKNSPCILFFDELDSLTPARGLQGTDETHKQAMTQLLIEIDGFQKNSNVIIVGATNRPDMIDAAMIRPGRFDKLIYMPLPDKDGRKKIFGIYLNKLPVSSSINLNELAEKTERYSGADIKAMCESVAQRVAQEASNEHKVLEITQQDILTVVRGTKPSTSLAQIEDYEKFKLDFERSSFKTQGEERKGIQIADIIGLEEAKKAIRDAIEIPLLYPELMKKYDIKPINGLLLFGPPGVGKTMLMRAVNNEMKNVTMLEISGSTLTEEGIEAATATIKEIFNRAKENAPAIIFIDEIEGVLPNREGATEQSVQITTEVLKAIDGVKSLSNVVIVGATNLPYAVDPAMLRPGRFDKIIFIRPPSATERAAMLKKYIGVVKIEGSLDFDRLAAQTKGFTGADIANVCREAKTDALKQEVSTGDEGAINMDSMEAIIKDTKPSAPDSVLIRYQAFLTKYGRR